MTNFAIVILCAILCIKFSSQDKQLVHMNAQDVQKMRQAAAICEKETGVPAAVLKKIIDWPIDDDEATKKFFYCVCFNSDYIDKDGHMIIENLVTFTARNGTQEDFFNNLRECNNITLENYLETVFAIGNCFHEKLLLIIDN